MNAVPGARRADLPAEAAGAALRQASVMTEPERQPRDITLEQETPEQAADLEARSEPEDPTTDDPAELSEGRS